LTLRFAVALAAVALLAAVLAAPAGDRRSATRSAVPSGHAPSGASEGHFESSDHPRVVSAATASRYLQGDEPVLAVSVTGRARAYPIRIMIWHEVANDVLGGRPVLVTYCPLCNSGVAFDRLVGGRVLGFGTTGLLRLSNLVMWDRQTDSWWQQFDGRALVGRLADSRLRMLPSEMLSWRDFKRRYPHGDVLAQATGYDRPYGLNPYLRYDTGDQAFGFNGTRTDRRLPQMARVLAVRSGGRTLAVPYSLLNVRVGRRPVAVFYERAVLSPLDATRIDNSRKVGTAVAYERRLGWRTLSFEAVAGRAVDRQTRSRWDMSSHALSGPLRGRSLRPWCRTRSSGSHSRHSLPTYGSPAQGPEIVPGLASARARR
jgi:hypothetical protein